MRPSGISIDAEQYKIFVGAGLNPAPTEGKSLVRLLSPICLSNHEQDKI